MIRLSQVRNPPLPTPGVGFFLNRLNNQRAGQVDPANNSCSKTQIFGANRVSFVAIGIAIRGEKSRPPRLLRL